MKFGEQLTTQLTPEWRKKYIDYEGLKKILYSRLEKAPSAEIDNGERRERYFARQDEEFFIRCEDELEKINLFFNQKLAESQSKHRDLLTELESAKKDTATRRDKADVDAAAPIIFTPFGRARQRRKTSVTERDAAALLAEGDEKDEQLPSRTERDMKDALKEFYLALVLLQNYQQMNITGFRKILKKHDKTWQNSRGSDWKKLKVDTAPYALSKEVDNLIEQIESVYTEQLELGNRQKAMKSLRVPPLSEKQSAWTTFFFGFFLGTFVVVFCTIALSTFYVSGLWNPPWVVVRLYRGFFLLFVNIFLMGLNMYIWQSSGVNHVLIFEIDPRNHLTYQNLLAMGAIFCSVWGISLLGYFYAPVMNLPRLCFPLILMGVCLLWTFNPFNCMWRSSRFWLVRRIFCCFTAPFHAVTFPDFWLADQMNSLVTFFLDMEYLCCFYISEVEYGHGGMWFKFKNYTVTGGNANSTAFSAATGIDKTTGSDVCSSNVYGIRPLISLLPALIRFLQCLRRYRDNREVFPHLVNAGKYSTTFFVVIFGSLNTWDKQRRGLKQQHLDSPYFYIWILAYVVSFCYTYFWDVKMDWGLFAKRPGEHRWLREELIYKKIWWYYFAIAADAVMRLGWVLNVSLGDAWLDAAEADTIMCITAIIECGRRCMWNVFRLENEHLNNVGQFRAVRDISIQPMHKNDFDELTELIDEDDGVTHRGGQFQTLLQRKLKAVGAGKKAAGRFREKFLRKRNRANFGAGAGRPSVASFDYAENKSEDAEEEGVAKEMYVDERSGSVGSRRSASVAEGARKKSVVITIDSGKYTSENFKSV